ncbi:hypothetical protein [Anabaena azotica]|uniref:pilus assembly PilX family protein n=1 Tax=Anabaena azotica TaxID=197653 RepID=UPI0039A6DD5C
MNTRFKMALLLHSGESGFALVIAISLGLIMILVGLTMTMRSQEDQVASSTQKNTERALAAAEKGVTYYQAFINSNRLLSTYPDCRTTRTRAGQACSDPANPTAVSQMSWSNASKIPEIASACSRTTSTGNIESVYASTDWQNVNSSDNSQGQFRLVSYQYISRSDTVFLGTGRLTVEGRINPQGNSNTNKSISRVQADIPVRKPAIDNIPIPGVWIGGSNAEDPDATGRNEIAADVLVNNCNLDLSTLNVRTSANYSANYTDMGMPNVPAMPADRTTSVSGNTTNVITNGTIQLGNITSDTTLPRLTQPSVGKVPGTNINNPTDTPTSFMGGINDTYVYSVGDIGSSGGGNIDLTIDPRYKVVIFMSGSIYKNTNIDYCTDKTTGTRAAGCNPLNFKIFGTGSSGSICINGNRTLEAFILAPTYSVGVAGAAANPAIRGNVWAKIWRNPNTDTTSESCDSNTSNLAVQQTGSWNDLGDLTPRNLQPPLSPIREWKRQNVN